MKHPPTIAHNYIAKAVALGLVLQPGEIAHIQVQHDEWCDIHLGAFCNCEAVVSEITEEEALALYKPKDGQ